MYFLDYIPLSIFSCFVLKCVVTLILGMRNVFKRLGGIYELVT